MSIREELADIISEGIALANGHTCWIADAILERYAVVERPGVPVPTEIGSAPGVKLWYLAGLTVTAGPGEVTFREIFSNRSPNGARTLAAVLAEAADHAESQS